MRKIPAILLSLSLALALAAQEPRLSSSSIGPNEVPAAILSLPMAARVSVSAASSIGVPISLHDKMEGELARSGSAGERDGRIDVTLDAGEYRVALEDRDAPGKAVRLSVRAFKDVGAAGARLTPGRADASALKDLESASYWIELREDGAIEVEAMGRALAVLELWREGQYMIGSYPIREERQSESGKPMGYACASFPAKAGLYQVRLHGGPTRAWPKDDATSPLYVRSGFIGMPIGGMLDLKVSPFGRDFVMAEGVDSAILSRAAKGTALLGSASYAPGIDRLSADRSSAIAKDAIDLRCRVDVPQGRALLRIEARPGDAVSLAAYRNLTEARIGEAEMRAGGLLTVIAAASQAPELPVTGFAYRLADGKAQVAKDFTLPLSPSSSVRGRCNLGAQGERSMYLRVEEAGDYQVAEKSGSGQAEATYALQSLGPDLRPSGRISSKGILQGQTYPLSRGYYLLSIYPKTIGLLDFALFKGGFGKAPGELAKEPIALRLSQSWTFDSDPSASSLSLVAGRGPSFGCGYSFVRNPAAAQGSSLSTASDKLPAPAATLFGSGTISLGVGTTLWRDFGRADNAVYAFEVKEAAVYVVETVGRLSTSLYLHSASRLKLFAASANGYGKNASIRAWLRPGRYYVEATTFGQSAGRGGLRMDRVPLTATASLEAGSVDRRVLPADSAARFSLSLPREQDMELSSVGLASAFPIRLEDAEGFIAYRGEGRARLRLAAGSYLLYSLPVSIDTNRLTWFRPLERAPAAALLPGTKVLELNTPASSVWREGKAPDAWSFKVPSALQAKLTLPAAFSAVLDGPGGARSLDTASFERIALEKGAYTISVRPRDVADQVPYSIALYTSVLAPGVAGISAPGSKPSSTLVSVPEDGFYELWSLGRSDVAARLFRATAAGAAVGELIAASDDNGPDWNFDIVRRLKAGYYRLEVSSFAGGSEPVELYLTSRNARLLAAASVPYDSKAPMDESGVLLPFDAKVGDGLYLVKADGEDPVSLRLYRGDEFLASGEGSIAIPLRGGSRYSLYAWTPFAAKPSLSIRRLQEKEASISAPLSLESGGVARLRNAEALSAVLASGRLLVSPGLEIPCYEALAAPFSTTDAGGWAWAPEGSASATPLALAGGEGAVLELSDIGQGFGSSSADKAILVSVDTRGQFRCGVSAKSSSSPGAAPFDWEASADWSQGSLALLPPGSWKTRVWDGERQLAKQGIGLTRRAGVGIDFLELRALSALKMGARDTIVVGAGEAVSMDVPACTLSILMGRGLVLSAWKEGDALATRASAEGRSADTLALKACKILVANRGASEASLRFAVLPARASAEDELSASRPFEAVGLPPEGIRLDLKASAGELLCLAGDSFEAELEAADGRFIRAAREASSGLFNSFPAASGSLRIRSSSGLVRAYLAKSGKEVDGLVAQEASLTARELADAALLSGKGDAFKLKLSAPGYVDLSCPGPGVLSLSGSLIERRVAVSGSREDMHLFAWLPAGEYGVWQRPARGAAAGGMLRADKVLSREFDAEARGPKAFIGAREYQAWSFEVKVAGKVGVGVKADRDGLQGFIYDSKQGLVATGPLAFPELEKGRYILVVKGLDSIPIEYELVLIGLDGSRLGVPSEVVDKYKASGGASASIAVPMRRRSPAAQRQASQRPVVEQDAEEYSEGDEEYESGDGSEGEYRDGDDGEYEGDNEGDYESEGGENEE